MATSVVQIWNMALGFLKNTNSVQAENENSLEAKQCRIYYDTALGVVLRGHLWGFAKKQSTLALTGTPPTGWKFQYIYPTDAIKVGRIFNPADPQGLCFPKVDFEVAQNPNGNGKVIWTNLKEAQLIYGIEVTDTGQWTPDFDYALALFLGVQLALSLANNAQRSGDLLNLYFAFVNTAQVNSTREGTKNVNLEASQISARR